MERKTFTEAQKEVPLFSSIMCVLAVTSWYEWGSVTALAYTMHAVTCAEGGGDGLGRHGQGWLPGGTSATSLIEQQEGLLGVPRCPPLIMK